MLIWLLLVLFYVLLLLNFVLFWGEVACGEDRY